MDKAERSSKDSDSTLEFYTPKQKLAAGAVHLFTVTGVIWASLATLALAEGRLLEMWGWLAISLVVDGIDGTLARKARVGQVIPWFDGIALDLIVDYLTWTFIPALFIYQHLYFGPGNLHDKIISILVMVVICTSSMFCYCNKQMKSSDNYFVGFPAAWNIVGLSLWLVDWPWYFNLSIVVLMVVLTVTPLKFCHPFRVKRLMVYNLVATAIWFICIIWLTIVFPARPTLVWWGWWLGGIWLMGVGFVRTLQGPDKD